MTAPKTQRADITRFFRSLISARTALTIVLPCIVLGVTYWLAAAPILASPYWGDDIGDSQAPMQFALSNQNLFDWWWAFTEGWARSAGRFFPLAILNGGLVFTTFTDRETYKAFQFADNLVVFTIFGALAVTIFRSRWAGYLAFGGALLTMQFKCWYDPFWQFGGQQQLWTGLILLAAIMVVWCVRTQNQMVAFALLIGSSTCYAAAVITYESSLFLVVAIVILAIRERATRSRIILVVVTLGLTGGILLANLLILRTHADVTNPGYIVSYDPELVATTLYRQMTGAIPLSYRYMQDASIVTKPLALPSPTPLGALGVVAFATLMTVSISNVVRRRHKRLFFVLLAGLIFWVVPSGYVAISSRWQMEVQPGFPYIPVFMGGLALVLVSITTMILIARLVTRSTAPRLLEASRPSIFTCAVLGISLGALYVIQTSASREAISCEPFRVLQLRRDTFAHAVTTGLFDSIPPSSIVVHEPEAWWDWKNQAFVAWWGGPRDIHFVSPAIAANAGCERSNGKCFEIEERLTSPTTVQYRLLPF